MKRSLPRLAPVLLALGWGALWAAQTPRKPTARWGPKDFGVLILAQSAGGDLDQTVASLRKSLGWQVPIEIAVGSPTTRDLRRAIDLLQAANVRKIVAVPLYLSSQAEEIEQTQYLLGLRRLPSYGLMTKPHAHLREAKIPRALPKVPLVMSAALDDHPLVAQALLARARELSKEPGREAVILVGMGAARKEGDYLRVRLMNSLARQVQKLGRFHLVLGAALRPDAEPAESQKAEKELRDLIRTLSTDSRVLVMPYLLTQDGTERMIQKKLEGLFFRWKGRGLLPEPSLSEWVKNKISESRDLPDMVRYKDAGQTLPPPEPKRIVQ